jgi:hypothetical protein
MTNDTVSILGSPPNYDSEGVSSARSNATRSIIGSRRGLPNADVTKLPGRRPLPPPADFAPATVYFVWCNTQRRKFSFPHYLSVRAAIHAVGADAVWFYFALQPTADRWSHETWLGELEAEFPFFRRRPLFDLGHLDACVGNRPADDFVAWLVSTHGGIYVDVETAIADFRPSLRSLDVLAAYTEDRGNSSRNELRSKAVRRLRLLMAKKGQLCGGSANDIAKPRVQVTTCLAYGESDVVTTRNHKPPICVVLPSALLPKDLWTDGTNGDDATMVSTVGRYLRTAFYGRPEIPKPVADYSNLVPNTGHMVWVDGGEMKFVFFLSVLSLLHCAGVDAVYVHGDQPPSGVYWKLLLATQTDRVKFVQRENMGQVRNCLNSKGSINAGWIIIETSNTTILIRGN